MGKRFWEGKSSRCCGCHSRGVKGECKGLAMDGRGTQEGGRAYGWLRREGLRRT